MTANTIGDNFRVTTFGESHGPALGVVIDGLRPGIRVDLDAIQQDLDRRRPGTSKLSSPRKEADRLEVLSGIFEGKTTGAPIAFLFRNVDAKSNAYESIKDLFRPGHADFSWWHKYGIRDWRGGGRSSGRETIARVAAGALAKQVLNLEGVTITGHVVQIGSQKADSFDAAEIERNPIRCADKNATPRMAGQIEAARKQGDSVGGIVAVVAQGVPAGWGDPVFAKLDALLGAAFLSIGAVKGIEFGDGFSLAHQRGSKANDPILPDGFGSNHMGGILGGVSSGAPITVRLAVKPTPSIALSQETIDTHGRPQTISTKGRHDPCICPRLVPVAEAMMAIILCDAFLRQQALQEASANQEQWAAELSFREAEILRAIYLHQKIVQTKGEYSGLEEQLTRQRAELAKQLGLSLDTINSIFSLINKFSQEP
jgi:chorismate synthase